MRTSILLQSEVKEKFDRLKRDYRYQLGDDGFALGVISSNAMLDMLMTFYEQNQKKKKKSKK